jgi:hypothetical protein
MRRRRKSVGLIAFCIFVACIVAGGFALKTAGYVDNPFDQIAFLSNWENGGEGRFERDFAVNAGSAALPASDASSVNPTGRSAASSKFQLPPPDELSGSDTASNPGANVPVGPGRGDQNSIAWSDLGDVLYDLWFICATTAVFIVVQQVFRFSLKQFKSRMPRVAAAK